MLSANALHSSRDAAANGDIEGALDAANDAIDLQPLGGRPADPARAGLRAGAATTTRRREAIDEAISRSPDDYRLRLLAARMEVEAGDHAEARAALARGPARSTPATPRSPSRAATSWRGA